MGKQKNKIYCIDKFKKIKSPFLFTIENKEQIIKECNITSTDFDEIKKLVKFNLIEIILQKLKTTIFDVDLIDNNLTELFNYEFKCDNPNVRRIFFTIPVVNINRLSNNVLAVVLSVYYYNHTKSVNTFHITYGKWIKEDGHNVMPIESITWNNPGIYACYKALAAFGCDELLIKLSEQFIESI